MDFQLAPAAGAGRRDWLAAAVVGAAFFLLGWFSLANDRDETVHAAYVWLASGVAVGALWVLPVARWWPALGAVLAAMLGLVALEREPVASAAGWIVAELVGVAAAGFLLRRFAGEARLDSLDKVWRFLLAGALVNAVVSGAIGAPVFAAVFGKPVLAEWRAWVLAHAIGVTLVAPVVVSWAGFHAKRSGGLQRAPFWAGLVCLAGMLVTALAVFDRPDATAIIAAGGRALSLGLLPYVPLAFAVLVSLAWGQRGGSLAILVLGIFAILNTAQGDGPFTTFAAQRGERLLDAEAYVGTAALLGLFVAALRAREERALREAADWRIRYELAAQASHVKLYELDPRTRQLIWGGDLTSWVGLAAGNEASLERWLERVHPDDRPRVELAFAARLAGERDVPPQRYRVRKESGDWFEVEDIGGAVLDFDDTVHRVAGTVRLIGATG
jgi:integral membrane sensor domain MASE1